MLIGIYRRHRIAALISICAIAFALRNASAQSADDFFHGGARSYLSNNVAGAQKEVDQGLKLFPDDIKLKKLDELLKQQQQQQQQQQNQQQQQQNQSQQNQSKQNQQQKSQEQKQKEEQKQQKQNKQQQEQAEQQKEKEQQAQAREMTPDQAKQLMDREKVDEMLLPASRKEKPHNQEGPIKDW